MNETDKLEEMLCTTTKLIISLNPDPITLQNFIVNVTNIIMKHVSFKHLTFQALEESNGYNLDEHKLLQELEKAIKPATDVLDNHHQ